MGLQFSDINLGDIYFRDRWQFELKSDFIPHPDIKQNMYTQEFYIFVPNVLHIHRDSYKGKDFYRDQTNYIRFKTPVFSFDELLDKNNIASPLTELHSLLENEQTDESKKSIEEEIKLLGNIFRSTLREKVESIIENVTAQEVDKLCKHIRKFREVEKNLAHQFETNWSDNMVSMHFNYLSEFSSNIINTKLVHLIKGIKDSKTYPRVKKEIFSLMREEQTFRESRALETESEESDTYSNEYVIYRRKLLDKFIGSVLLLQSNRFSMKKAFRNIIGAFSAGIAMLIFMILFVSGGEVFVINSTPFIVATVIFYILKDRIKEWLRSYSFKIAFKWFPDYTTKIFAPDGKAELGELKEFFSIFSPEDAPDEISKLRNTEFHTVLESFKRPETVLYHKKSVKIVPPPPLIPQTRQGMNIIFRLNIHKFVLKASDPIYMYTKLDNEDNLITQNLPKVYHLNIIVKNTYVHEDLSEKIEFKKYRLILDKNGIKRVETLD